MIKFYYTNAPNPLKVALFLEEAGLSYEPIPIDIAKGEQHNPKYLSINPNAKVPAIIDDSVIVFDSNAILIYLSEKTGLFLHKDDMHSYGALLSWLMFVATGVGPYSGQAAHFNMPTIKKNPYAIKRYEYESRRHYDILDKHLALHHYMLGDYYSIVDMAVWGWARHAAYVLGEGEYKKLMNLERLVDEINARPAALRAIALMESSVFKSEMDEDAHNNMYKYMCTDSEK